MAGTTYVILKLGRKSASRLKSYGGDAPAAFAALADHQQVGRLVCLVRESMAGVRVLETVGMEIDDLLNDQWLMAEIRTAIRCDERRPIDPPQESNLPKDAA